MSHWLIVGLGLLPGLVWLVFFLQEDRRRPEPKRLIIYTFILGIISTFLILQVQIVANAFMTAIGFLQWSLFSIFWLAAIEEIGKFLVVYVGVHKRREFDEAIDPMIYMIVASLGFATVENVASALRTPESVELIILRFVGATLLHSLSSGLVGYWWSLSMYHKRHRVTDLLLGLLYASVFHTIFNVLVVRFGPGMIVTLLLIFVAFFVLNDFEKLKRVTQPLPEEAK